MQLDPSRPGFVADAEFEPGCEFFELFFYLEPVGGKVPDLAGGMPPVVSDGDGNGVLMDVKTDKT